MCVSPIRIRYVDRVRGGYSTQDVPCCKCVECLRNKQDEWAMRIRFEAERSGSFIFDTFTYSNDRVPLLDATALIEDYSKLSWQTIEYLERNDFYVMYPDYSDIRDHIKRGRELYYKRHGKRLNLKYFICSEYGDKLTNNYRPHFHLVVFGVSLRVWQEYFASPWATRFGFVYTKELSSNDSKHLNNIARYVGKYCTKGSFDVPIVRDGIAPKPFKLCSNGIGIGYYDIFHKQMSVFNKYISAFSSVPDCPRDFAKLVSTDSRYYQLLQLFKTTRVEELFKLVDSGGYVHRLPRYYRDKLFGSSSSIFKTCLQMYLVRRYDSIREEALYKLSCAKGYREYRRDKMLSANGVYLERFGRFLDSAYNAQESKKSLQVYRTQQKLTHQYL